VSAEAVLYQRFLQAVALAGAGFADSLTYHAARWLPARSHVRAALDARHAVHPSGQVIKLEVFCPWKEHLYELEEELECVGEIKYCLYEVSTRTTGEKNWEYGVVVESGDLGKGRDEEEEEEDI
jgi:uncharacterized UPF0160 family protein